MASLFPLRRAAGDRAPARQRPASAGNRRRRLHERATRAGIAQKGISVWLKADFEVLMKRVKRRSTADRPMLQGDPAQRVRQLMDERYPVYATADMTVMSRDVAHDTIVTEIIAELARLLGVAAPAPAGAAE
jgi:hypothetical protein